ncbi:hypothetical protein BDP27DRAFT_1242445 [Rhodocollybia butyracea]|uniref:CxC1-like cysteine cluster associated with KDZ transposases domain-containing protein n=1 Tax=Rhodocollybia butyracea TaxID=206335 RepID=A0A9P5P6Z8_9AGAR|nr:hypothetical protein BDP27DRAFT_1242445 [Rhodocollybia butyracea]
MEIDGIGSDINAGDTADGEDSSAELNSSRNVVVDLRDFIGVNKWHGRRKYKDARTWKQRIQRFNNAWASIITELVDEYICWKYNSKPSTCSPSDSWEFSIEIIDVHSLTRQTTIYRDSETKATSALVRAGYLPASPESPSVAVSLRTLELFYAMRLFKPNFSVEAFAKMVCYLHSEPYRRTYRTALSDTFDIYLAILRKVESRVAKELGHDSPDYRALNSCPPCTYELEGEPPQTFSRMVVVDGNNSLKRLDGVGKREVADTRVFGESDYYLSEEFVNLYADEVPARPLPKPAVEVEEDFTEDVVQGKYGDPTDGDSDPALRECTDNWKASDAEGAKKMWDAFRESGYFVMACRHGFVMWVADMIRSGELAKYPLAMVAKALKVFGSHWLLGYDIGCSFGGTIRRSSLGPEFDKKKCRTCVNAFHGYAHCALCQQIYHPLNICGMGLEDLETLERLFSSSNQLASITRYMSPYRRRVFIDLFLQQWDREKYQNLATMLHNNYVQALDVLEYELPSFEADIQALGLTKGDLDAYIAEESHHFATLGSETAEDLHAVAYVELLRKYKEVNTAYENSSTNFRLHTPLDYQFLSDAASYNANLSEGRKTETRRHYLLEQRDKILFEIVQLEMVMNVHCRWDPSDLEYKQAVEYLNTRKYRRALERLQKLVVQRLFELHKMNLSNTGTALQRRSAAIRNAVKTYNAAALSLDPPRDTLDWSKVSHFTFLDQFNILQDTRHSVFDQPWAKPVVRSLMKQHRQIERAREEIIHCNIGIRRLHTSIVDEEKNFDIALQKLNDAPLFGPVSDYVRRRKAVNALLLARIHQTYNLPGFTGDFTPGKRKGSTDPLETCTTVPQACPDPESDNGEDEDDDEFIDGVGAMVDFMSSMSVQ